MNFAYVVVPVCIDLKVIPALLSSMGSVHSTQSSGSLEAIRTAIRLKEHLIRNGLNCELRVEKERGLRTTVRLTTDNVEIVAVHSIRIPAGRRVRMRRPDLTGAVLPVKVRT